MRLSLLPLVALAGSAFASGDSISTAIDSISNATLALNHTIATWPQTLLGALPITTKSTLLALEIHKGTVIARESGPLSLDETLQVAKATSELSSDVELTINTIIATKPNFDRLQISPVILLNLELQRGLSADFSAAVIEKVPKELQGNAKQLVAGIDASFARAIKKFSKLRG
ncbi:Cell wall galactomannoprotein [Fusarium austroafricanum]|uniref:Cell wall galactomannoprotein n=1 Tax=Fusarium austroafricanum TaxID=2364996 RepID=A0A8H4NXY7_9HYPO|nr:Cell wall galactomannoprotein [Fusarium austroafricanum]